MPIHQPIGRIDEEARAHHSMGFSRGRKNASWLLTLRIYRSNCASIFVWAYAARDTKASRCPRSVARYFCKHTGIQHNLFKFILGSIKPNRAAGGRAKCLQQTKPSGKAWLYVAPDFPQRRFCGAIRPDEDDLFAQQQAAIMGDLKAYAHARRGSISGTPQIRVRGLKPFGF